MISTRSDYSLRKDRFFFLASDRFFEEE